MAKSQKKHFVGTMDWSYMLAKVMLPVFFKGIIDPFPEIQLPGADYGGRPYGLTKRCRTGSGALQPWDQQLRQVWHAHHDRYANHPLSRHSQRDDSSSKPSR
jgi:hypothetical protein